MQPPAKPGNDHQDDQNSDKGDHHESKQRLWPELFIVSQMITHAVVMHDPSSIEQCVMHSMSLDGVPLALNFRVQGRLKSLPAFYVSNR